MHLDLETGLISGSHAVERRLSSLEGSFANKSAYAEAIAAGDPIVYSVSSVEPGQGEGDLHYGLGVIQPGKVGDEYYLTKGHLHSWRDAAEVYIGLRGQGVMLLEDERTGESEMLPLLPENAVYVPGYIAHRTINTGEVPLVYIGIYPARSGHDYGAIGSRNFREVVVDRNGEPTLMSRQDYLASLSAAK
jgi:glucose-6-phosphate isomerase